MKIRLWPKKRWTRAAVLLAAVLLVPYGFSRLASPWRCVTVFALPEARAVPGPSARLRVACYNVAHGRGTARSNRDGGNRARRLARLDRIAELLRSIDADVVVLNEVDFDSTWSHSVNQARYLAEKSGYAYRAEQRNLDFRILAWTWRFGNAVLSKHPIAGARVVDLPGYSTWETALAGKKRAVICDVLVGDETVRVIGAHLSHRSEALRVRSAALLADVAAQGALPTIVAGDLNSTPPDFPRSAGDENGNNAIKTFDDSGRFRRSPSTGPLAERDLTFHSADPRSVIDWILIPRDWRFLQYRVNPSQLSDHRPVYADMVPGER